MAEAIKDGTGNGYLAEVSSDNKLRTRAISEPSIDHAAELGKAYNINTGTISSLANGTSAILYFYNGEEESMVIDAIAVGLTDGTASDIQTVTVVRDPTGGTIVSGATAVDMNQNRNFGSALSLADSLAYKGADTLTLTGGSDIAQFYMTDNGRLYAAVNFVLPKGKAIGIELTAALSSGTISAYAALVCHQEDIV